MSRFSHNTRSPVGLAHLASLRRSLVIAGLLGLTFSLLVAGGDDHLQTHATAKAAPGASLSVVATGSPVRQTTVLPLWQDWRWSSEDGVHFIEYTLRPRAKPEPLRLSPIMDAGREGPDTAVVISHASGRSYLR